MMYPPIMFGALSSVGTPGQPRARQTGSDKTGPAPCRWRTAAAGLIVAAAGLLAYSNSLSGPFIFDDTTSIPENPNIRRLWPIWNAAWAPPRTTATGRPMLCLSLAINYRISGLDVRSYHAVNLAIHILAGLTLFGVVRRTLLLDRLKGRFGASSTMLALICSLVWLVHPLQTSSVTYVIQRAESLMGLFYLLTMYCAIRGLSPQSSRLWQLAAIATCAAGMGTKEVMVTAPLMVALYDRIFSFGSFKEAVGRRWRLYAGLAATWVILAALVAGGPRSGSAGFDLREVGPLDYAVTQCKVILHYLRLSFWPDKLVLDYRWPMTRAFTGSTGPTAMLIALLAAVVVALRYRPGLGFLGLWFFLILGPSSSFVPLADAAFEHRMYLPLAAVIVGVVLAAQQAGGRLIGRRPAAPVVGYVLAACIVVGLGLLTLRRNTDYRSDVSIWQDTINKVSGNSRAHLNLATAYTRQEEYERAIIDFDRAIELDGESSQAYGNRGAAYFHMGQHAQAIRDSFRAVKLDPDCATAHCLLGLLLPWQGRTEEAISHYRQALRIKPDFPDALNNLAWLLATHADPAFRNGREAVELAERACTLTEYKSSEQLDTLAASYAEAGRFDQAVQVAQKASDLAAGGKQEQLAADIRSRLELYRTKQPYREAPSTRSADSRQSPSQSSTTGLAQ